MPNQRYLSGARAERQVINMFKGKKGYYVGRTRGSHGAFDVFIINTIDKRIDFIQVKNKKYISPKEYLGGNKMAENNGEYYVHFGFWGKMDLKLHRKAHREAKKREKVLSDEVAKGLKPLAA